MRGTLAGVAGGVLFLSALAGCSGDIDFHSDRGLDDMTCDDSGCWMCRSSSDCEEYRCDATHQCPQDTECSSDGRCLPDGASGNPNDKCDSNDDCAVGQICTPALSSTAPTVPRCSRWAPRISR